MVNAMKIKMNWRLTSNTCKNVEILPHSGLITFQLRHSRGEMYIGHGRLCVCVSACVSISLSLAAFPHYCTDQDATCGNGGVAL